MADVFEVIYLTTHIKVLSLEILSGHSLNDKKGLKAIGNGLEVKIRLSKLKGATAIYSVDNDHLFCRMLNVWWGGESIIAPVPRDKLQKH